jgi:hypothetical protein
MSSAAFRVLPSPRQDPAQLVEALDHYWGINVRPQELVFPQDGRSGADTVLFQVYASKSLSDQSENIIRVFTHEHKALLGITRELQQTGMTVEALFGVDDIARLVLPQKDHNFALFVMPRLEGSAVRRVPHLAHQDFFIEKMSRFCVGFDKVMTRQYPDAIPQNPEPSRMALGLEPLPANVADFADLLSIAQDNLHKLPDTKPRHMHNDMSPGNTLVDQEHKLSIIDFGQVSFGNPHFGLTVFLTIRLIVYGIENVESTFKIISRINELSGSEPWADPKHCVTHMPIRLANFVQRFQRPQYNGNIPPDELAKIRQWTKGLRKLFDNLGIRKPLVQGHTIESVRPTPKTERDPGGIDL